MLEIIAVIRVLCVRELLCFGLALCIQGISLVDER